ncbi:MAG: hypothetical protein OEX11_10275, partial [Nitrosomonas sp.]|nr:hypothetical protein [Nitrosomonas sp.]
MQKTKRLSRRITYAFLLFGAILTLMLGLSMIVALKSIERSVLDDILYTELMTFQQQDKNTSALSQTPLSRSTINSYTASLDQITNMPEHVRDLPQGIHDVTYDNRDYRVLVE